MISLRSYLSNKEIDDKTRRADAAVVDRSHVDVLYSLLVVSVHERRGQLCANSYLIQ